MAVTFPSDSTSMARVGVGAVNDDLYRTSAETLRGTSAYWDQIVTGLAGPPEPLFASLYVVEDFDESAGSVEAVHFIEAPPDDTDW